MGKDEAEKEDEAEGERCFREMRVVMGRRGDKSLHPARSDSDG